MSASISDVKTLVIEPYLAAGDYLASFFVDDAGNYADGPAAFHSVGHDRADFGDIRRTQTNSGRQRHADPSGFHRHCGADLQVCAGPPGPARFP
jgi:hypothetical protein